MIRFVARMVTRLACTVTLLATVAAVPVGLVSFVGWPLPDHVPSRDELYRFATSAMSDQTVLDATAIALWLFWTLFTVAVVLETVAKIRGVQAPRITLLAPVQGLAATLVTGLTAGILAVASVSPLVPALSHGQPPVVTAAAAVQEPPAVMPVARYDTVTAPAQLTTRTAGTVTLIIDDCGYNHKVVNGDSLWRIAKECLGNPERWPEIWELNKGEYWPHVSGHTTFRDPGLIFPGWVLTLPAGATAPPGAQPVDPPVTIAPQVAQTPSPQVSPSQPTTVPSPSITTPRITPSGEDGVFVPPPPLPTGSPRVSASPSVTASPSRSVSPATSPSASGSASPTPGTPDASDEAAALASTLDGVDLPGGWITLGLGAGLLAAVAMVWRRRRQRYKPIPITSPQLDEPDLLPPLAAMTRIRSTLRRSAPDGIDDQPVPSPTVREYRAAAVKPELPPVGPSGSDLVGAAALPLSTGLGLIGDGALDAARGLLVATLASGSDDDPDAKGRAIIPATTLATLLGVSVVDLGHLDRLTVTASDADAITQLEEEIIRRSRLIADAQAADVQSLRGNGSHAEPLPQLLLITELPDPAWTNRLVTAVRLGHSVDIGAAMIGDWPTGTTLTVAADGTTGNDDTPRLAVLDTTAAIEMLGLLREAHGDSYSDISAAERRTLPQPAVPVPDQPDDVTVDWDASKDTEQDPEPVDDTPAPAAADGRLPVAVRVLGRPAVLDPDGQPSPGIRSKAVELLVYLAVNRKGADLLDIMDALYPDANMRRASERLSTVAADLRKHIRRVAATPADTEQTLKQRLEPIVNTGGHYHLDPTIVSVDWWTVTDQYGAVVAATDDTQRLAHLTAAIEAATGPLAEGLDYDWIDTDREVVRRHRIKLHAHAAALLADSDPHQSWLLLEQACQIDPLSDELARTTMRAAAALGDADAIRHRLKTLREALHSNGLELADETEALAKTLLRQLHPPRPSE